MSNNREYYRGVLLDIVEIYGNFGNNGNPMFWLPKLPLLPCFFIRRCRCIPIPLGRTYIPWLCYR